MGKKFWYAAFIRALKTFFQSLVVLIPVNGLINQVDWYTVILSSLLIMVASFVTSVAAGLPEVKLEEQIYPPEAQYDKEEE